MSNPEYLMAAAITSFAVTYVLMPQWIKVAVRRGFVGRDMNKLGDNYVAEGGGLWAVVGCVFGLYVLASLYRYLGNEPTYSDELFALTSLLLLTALLGFMDDVLGWKKGLPAWLRVAFIAPISIPLIVIKAGYSKLSIPFIGVVDLGIIYPLVAVPVGVLGAANAFNMIAGYNGLEVGMGLTLMAFTAIYSLIKGIDLVPQASLIMASSLMAFARFNWYPAKVFPGNTLTYAVGAYYASIVVLGNMEKFGISLFTLYFIEFLLFIRGLKDGVYKENFGVPRPDNSLDEPYDRVYSLTHLSIKLLKCLGIKPTEPKVTLTLISLQVMVGLIALTVNALGMI